MLIKKKGANREKPNAGCLKKKRSAYGFGDHLGNFVNKFKKKIMAAEYRETCLYNIKTVFVSTL